jgi:lambda family phage portal protein
VGASSFLGRVKTAFQALAGKSTGERDYLGARLGRGMSYIVGLQRQDAEIRRDIAGLRAHSRFLDKNNPWMRSFLRIMETDLVGPKGFTLQAQLRKGNGDLWEPYNANIEAAFKEWSSRETCCVDGRFSFLQVQRQMGRSLPLDGEVFIREVFGFDNGFGYALQFLDPDLLDHNVNQESGNGQNAIVMGVELDTWGRPVAYHFREPSLAWSQSYPYGSGRIRIPAEEIIHVYDPERANQTRGVPHAAPVMYVLAMLGGYLEAELAASRYEAERVVVYKSPDGTADDRSIQGAANTMTSPGLHATWLPTGVDIQPLDLKHPNSAFPPYVQCLQHALAAGLGVNYHALTRDLSQTNFSSMRGGELIDRDQKRRLQGLMIDAALGRIYRNWLKWAWVARKVTLPPGVGLAQASAHKWAARGWDWVDPLKDIQADVLAVNNCMDTLTNVLAERGLDFEEIATERAREQALLKALGVELAPLGGAVTVAKEEPAGKTPQDAGETPNPNQEGGEDAVA